MGSVSAGTLVLQDVEPVQGGLGGDLVGLALVAEAGVADLDVEVLFDAVALQGRADREADLVGAGQGAARDALGDLLKVALGRGQQLFALARALGGD